MCTNEHCEECNYNAFPTITIGGNTGDYQLEVPVVSCRWAEYQVVAIANGNMQASVFVTGDNDKPPQLDYTGAAVNKLSGDTSVRGLAFNAAANVTIIPPTRWERITHSQKKVFVRIDNAPGNSTFVSIRFRVRLLTIIPSPAASMHPDLEQQHHLQREERIKQRLAEAGIPASALETTGEKK